MPTALIQSFRPRQWIKNCFVFAAPLFSQIVFERPGSIAVALAAFFLFCFASSSVYLINDVLDLENDRKHPRKRHRPIASGRVSAPLALTAAVLLIGCALGGSVALAWLGPSGWSFPSLLALYFCLNLAYSVSLKHVVILDALFVAIGFVIRAMAGAEAVSVEISPWLLLCTILISLFLALSKRRHEIVLLEHEAGEHRAILREYSPYLLDQMISVVTASTLMAYALYTMDQGVQQKLGTEHLIYTVPFVIYGIFRYLYLVHQRLEGGDPSELILADRWFLVNVLIWALVSGILLWARW